MSGVVIQKIVGGSRIISFLIFLYESLRSDLIIFCMQPSSSSQINSMKNCEVTDPISQNVYTLEEGSLCVRSAAHSQLKKYPLEQNFENQARTRQPLRFKKTNASGLVFGPSGKSLTCKSDKIHEVDMNLTYTEGVFMWALSCSANCLSLIVGVKNSQKKKQHCLQFTIQNATRIVFKLDISSRKLKAWINKSLSIGEKKINLAEEVSEWTPFIRVKGVGVSVFLTDLVEDPEDKLSVYNIFGVRSTQLEPKLIQNDKIEANPSKYSNIRLIDPNTLLLNSNQEIRLIRREDHEQQFSCSLTQITADGKVFIKFTPSEIQVLNRVGFAISGEDYCGKSVEQWTSWMTCAFTSLDTQLHGEQISKEAHARASEILLTRIESFKSLIKSQVKSSPALESDLIANWGASQTLFPSPSINFKIPNSIRLNSEPGFKLSKDLKTIVWTEHYLVVLMSETERILILNRQDSLFRVAEINMKRGFKKEYELNQYQKELDMLQSTTSNEPSIYKILKNCLKYADKVKIPEKEVKQKQEKKENKGEKQKLKEKEKEKSKKVEANTPDKSLINTLVGMGFSQSQAQNALVQAKNSLQKAIQIILTQPQKQTKSPTKTTKLKTWDCPQCTLLNEESSKVCQVCEFPKPAVEEAIKIEEEVVMNQEKEDKEKIVEEDVESKNIQSGLRRLFAWELGFAYCPLVIAASFEGKLRVRFFGPNPKYYSMFYNRDEQFVDLTHLSIHNHAYEIDQKPIRYQFYLNSTQTEQKQSAYGWISIQDCDIDVKGDIENITFTRSASNEDKISFDMQILGENNGEKYVRSLRCFVSVEKIYAEKCRAVAIQNIDKKQEEQVVEKAELSQSPARQKLDSNQIPGNGYLELRLVKTQNKPETLKQIEEETTVVDKINQLKPYLPIIASHQSGSAEITTLISALQPGQKPLVLRHLQNKSMSVEYIVLQKIGKHPTNVPYKGYIYFSEDPSKKPLRKIKFQLQKGKKKFYIEAKQLDPSFFVGIQLLEEEKKNDSGVIEQIALVGLIGEEFDRKNRRGVKFTNLNREIQLQINDKDGKAQNPRYKIQAELLNSRYDLNVLSPSQLQEVIEELIKNESTMDLCIKLYNLQDSRLYLESLTLPGWQIIRQKSVWQSSSKSHILEQSYKQMLQKFLQTSQPSLLDTLVQQQNKQFLRLIRDGKYNLTKFFNDHVLGKKLDKAKRNKLINYFHQLGPYIQEMHKDGNLDYQEIIRNALKMEDNDLSSLEIVLEVSRHFPIQQQILTQNLIRNLQTLTNPQKSKKSQQQSQPHSYRAPNKTPSVNENTIYTRYIIQHGKLYRKYTLDMINLYKVHDFVLNFQRSHKRTGFRVVLKSCVGEDQWRVDFDQNYPEFVWEQLTICPYTDEFEKNIKQSKRQSKFNCLYLPLSSPIISRYLQLQISFNLHPNLGSGKAIENVPHSEIIPQIHGQYFGQAQYEVGIFRNTNNTEMLTFVKNIGGINKFNVKALKNAYYYDSDLAQPLKNQNLMATSSKSAEATLYQIACAEVDELISRGSDAYSQENLSVLLNSLSNLDRGVLLQKIMILLRKIAKTNQQAAITIYRTKLPSEHAFNSILRQSSLTPQSIIPILQKTPTKTQLQNSILFAKSKQNTKELFNQILHQSIKNKKIDEIVILHQKHGWAQDTVKVLDLAIQMGNTGVFRTVVGLSRDNRVLADYTRGLLGRDGLNDQFVYAFQQLMDKSRKVKEEEVTELLQSLIAHLTQQIQNEQYYDQSQISQKFTLLTSSLNLLSPKKPLLKSYISLFQKLPHKQNLLTKFLSLKQFKQSHTQDLIQLCINLLKVQLAKTGSRDGDNLGLIYQVLGFVFRVEGNVGGMWLEEFVDGKDGKDGDGINQVCQVFGEILIKELCFGGQPNSKLIDSNKRLKLSIGFCLSNLIIKASTLKQKFKSSLTPTKKSLQNYFKWLLLNQSPQPQSQHPSHTNSSNSFTKLQQATWLLITTYSSKQLEKVVGIFREEAEKQELEVGKIRSKVYRKLYEKRMLAMWGRYLGRMEEDAQDLCTLLIQEMFPKFMAKLINKDAYQLQLTHDTDKEKPESLTQKQYANSFQLQNEPNKPKDWLLYKNGAKNSVLRFDYPKGSSNSYQILLSLTNQQPLTLSKILIGFQLLETAQESYCIPREITVQGGKKLEELKFIGKLVEIPDNHYINFSVRVFGINCAQIQANKISSTLNKYSDVKYVKLTFRCPEPGFAADSVSVVDSSKSKNYGSSINFLSIQGYPNTISDTEQIQNVQCFIKKITSYRHKQSLHKLFSSPHNVKLFKDSLINLSTLIKNDQYSEDLNRFIMRVCEVNTQIGNQTIQKYLHLGNADTCAKIVSEVIILSEGEALRDRILVLHQFIKKNFDNLKMLEPFLNKFTQIVYVVEKNKKLKDMTIQLQFDSQQLCQIIKRDFSLISFAKYLCTIMTLQPPFCNLNINHPLILQTLLSSKTPLCLQCYQSLIISQKNSRSWFMKTNQLQSLSNNIMQKIKQNSSEIGSISTDLQILSSLCYNPNIKSIINKNRYNLDIFCLFVSQKYSPLLVDEANAGLRESFVNFVVRSVLGSENQKLVAQILKDSLASSAVDQNKNFVGQVFLPILNSYSKTTICMHPYNTEQQKILTDLNIKNTKSSPNPKKSKQNKTSTNKFRLPTNLISSNTKTEIFDRIKEKSKYQGGSFNLVANHGLQATSAFPSIQKSIRTINQPLLLLYKASSQVTKSQILGIFYNQKSQIRKMPLYWNQQCFMFIARENEPIKFLDIKKQVGKKFVDICGDDDDDGDDDGVGDRVIQVHFQNVPFCQICDNNVFGASYINLDVLRGTSYGQYRLDSAEYWLFEPMSIPSTHPQPESASLTSQLLTLYNPSFFQPTFQSRSILRLLRSDKIYEFPSSLTIRQLKQAVEVMRCRIKEDQESNFKIYTMDGAQVANQSTIQSLVKKNQEVYVVDLLCGVDSIVGMLDFNSEGKTQPTAYLPKKGIMKHFEEINGVTSMIKVIKKSLEGWKNKERKEKWHQYVLELEKFSSFPHFFGMYLKDSETFDLLFKLLSGLPDTEQDKKWDQLQTKSTQKLLKIISQILSMDKTTQFRQYAMKHEFFQTILQRLKILTNQFKRQWKQQQEKQVEQVSPSKQQDDDGTKQIKKKKGVGYGNDGSSNTKWMKGTTQAEMMKEFQVTELILNIVENFLDLKHWNVPKKVMENIYQSALLPYLEDSLRAGTLLQISKIPAKFKLVFKILRTLSRNPNLVPTLMPINKKYHPKQIESLQSLLKSLQNTATIFLSCLKPNKQSTSSEKVSEQLSKDIIATSKAVQEAVEEYVETHHDDGDENDMKNILQLPLDKKYRTLLKDLRFDYIDMKDGAKIKHHYSGNFNANYVPNQNKMIRLAQELADISTALPYEHTNAIFVRCDKDRVDFMQALIMGANGTPYGHGAFLFDVYFDDSYPNTPPKVNLTTTGHGKVRFNPNLYACGKVCLSLLGTWRGSASENWDPKVSTLLQVLVSIQAIIMSEEIYFNEPGFEGQQGTPEGEKKNEAYSNIVRYSNIKFAMIDNMRNPPKGFEHVIKRHFYLKQHQIMDECKKWLLYAEKRPANYIGLVNDHNNSWSTQFKKTKNQYKQMLEKAIEQLDQQFKKLPVPSIHDITSRKAQKKQKKKKQNTDMLKKLEEEAQEEIDVEYDKKDNSGNGKEIDINDEKVKDRWSRYIGAMGIDAVSKQSKADILVFGLGPMALEVIKNLVLSGCRRLTIIDEKNVSFEDLSGGFFYTEADIGKKRLESIMYKIRELNIYVKIDTLPLKDATEQVIKTYHLVFVTEMPFKDQFTLNEQCRAHNVKFISADFRGAHCRVFNDFGDKFEVLDKNGEEPTQVIIKSITSAENGLVTLLDGAKHPFEDGEVVHIKNVEGMAHKEDKTKSINGTLHKVKVVSVKSFQIGDTTMYEPYIRNGLAKNVKTPIFIKYQTMRQVYENSKEKLPIDENLQFYDFTKMSRNKQIHFCFAALDVFVQENNGKLPSPWDFKDADKFVQIFSKIYGEQTSAQLKNYARRFSLTCSGYLPPLGAYLGGFISQQIIKAITQKYKPLDACFYIDAEQIIPEITEQDKNVEGCNVISKKDHRDKGFEIVVGKHLLELIKNSTSFMIGSGAIGCQLLKNFAMIGLGTGEKGKITITDPDHIENSNLNRQFLFREKHISKPKSRTAAASVLLMNQHLKGHISALLERVSESTKNIFSNKFFESLTFVANALDNVAARRYVDQRCVENKIPLFQSGTLGPKGHTQVILPFKTESYGSQSDPVEEGQIPHCTLKMFPEETLHCVEWARDIFGKKFSLQPKAFNKIKDPKFKPQKDDIKSLNECLVMSNKGPKNFEDCVVYAITKFYKYFRDDIMQLLYTYPLDAKTKDGEPFWKLPKRPPTPIMKFDPENILHCTFIASMAVLVAKVYKIPFPKNFREEKERMYLGKEAASIKIPDFVPSDEKAKSILKETADEKKQNKAQQDEQKQKETQVNSDKNEVELHEEFLKNSKEMQVEAEEFEKDTDQNGHIDFIYSMANLRASNYKLDGMDWITTKLKAGRIVPALATTTTCVAGLQTLQICKYIKNLKLESMRNSFLNLAVPSLQMSEPGEVKKIKLNDKVEVNLWDRWQISCTDNTTFGEIYDHLRNKYGLNPIGVLQGMSRIDTSKTQEGKKEFLSSKLLDRLDKEDDCIDIIVLFTKTQQDDKMIENIPPVRLKFEAKKSA